ncbi:tetratricopeptide repeat protein [Sphingobacterium litopenaei]|uniref:Tetratricopeptide repeat protein n=1 Tax=Sphingobacterium litopenaei TaxID=2763500 RepID=A0ABR7YAR8_9SPHI|nr:tetratricopeptide repeat protein [Sphingobacterium litopenaei]MBD1428414.1 tetratricopeptide repeat protein [Sphingobacterium litopenaei]
MTLQANNYYILASSQLFPFSAAVNPSTEESDVIKIAKEAYDFVLNKQYTEALQSYSKAISLFPEQPFFYACRSILHRFNGDDESSFYDYQVAKRMDFNYHHYLEWLENQGEMLESEELLEITKSLVVQPDNAQLLINRAMLQVQHFNYAEAISDYSKGFVLNNDTTILISRAAIYMYVLQYDKALSDLNLVLETNPSLDAYLYRAKLYAAIKEYDAALKDFDAALQVDNQNTAIYEERAQLFEQLEQFDKAIADYSQIISQNADDFYAYVLRADIYEKTENWEEAIADYTSAIQLNPYYSDLYQYRGTLLEKVGDRAGAEADFAKFEELEEED